jgi:arabinogalactan endo-1,4-beta-galactosidase
MWLAAGFFCCSSSEDEGNPAEEGEFYFGADLSYVNQISDKGGVYKINGTPADPYKIFSDKGTDLVRLRLWHNPQWTKEVYGDQGSQLYNDIYDVEKAISKVKANGMNVLLDFHYSDTWADPGTQKIPAAWTEIKSMEVLEDSVYNYTYKTLNYLKSKDLSPEFVQIGNETNCGMMITDVPSGFPALNVCNGNWTTYGKVVNAGIRAVRAVDGNTAVKTKIILHVADPKNVEWWFDNMTAQVSDFDIVGFSYYPLWHTTVTVSALSDKIKLFKKKYKKDIMIMETAYPWTIQGDDNYNNHFGTEPEISGYPKTIQGQFDMLVKLTREVKEGGGVGLIYWEPAWISSGAKDLWGTGSSWENCAFFDFNGNAIKVLDYMQFDYQ